MTSGVILKERSQVSGNRGAALLVALIVLVFLAIFGTALITMIMSEMNTVIFDLDRLKAFYLAEAGISKALYEIKQNTDIHGDGMGAVSRTTLGAGTYVVEHDIDQKIFISTGEVNNNRRSIFIKYETRAEN